MRTAVVGHVEWVQFARVDHVPRPGEIVHAQDAWEEPGGGGAGAAVQLAKLSDETFFFTAFGNDLLADRATERLQHLGVHVHAARRDEPTRRALTHVDADGERTITVIGERLGPHGDDDLPWRELAAADATFFTAGDVRALRQARSSAVLVATLRASEVLAAARTRLDAVVGSALDPAEQYVAGAIDPPPALVVLTEGKAGGVYRVDGGSEQRFAAPPLTSPIVDRYGAGDSFAGGLTFALGRGSPPEEAVDFAARCGTAALGGRGPFEGQLAMSR